MPRNYIAESVNSPESLVCINKAEYWYLYNQVKVNTYARTRGRNMKRLSLIVMRTFRDFIDNPTLEQLENSESDTS